MLGRDVMVKSEVIKAIERKQPKRIPCWYKWFADEAIEKYSKGLDLISQNYSDDIILVNYDMPEGFVEPAPGRDEFTIYTVNRPGVFSGMRTSDLQGDWKKMEEFMSNFPSPYAEGRFKTASRVRLEYPDSYLVGNWWGTFYERMIALRGAQEFLLDLYLNRDKVEKLGDMICQFLCGIVEGFSQCGMDGVFFSDDLGTQRSLVFSPQIFRELFKPWYRKLFQRIRDKGMHVIMHSCGNIWEILPDLVECGLDVLHYQPIVMDSKRLVREFGKDLSFFGGIDVQQFLIVSTPKQVKEGIKSLFETLDHNGGGYIAGPANTIMPDTPLENLEAMHEAMWEYSLRNPG